MLSLNQAQENRPQGAETSSLVKQLVDIEILYLLTFSPKSGYELKKQLLNWFKINVSYGTLYPHLHSLEETGFISGKWQQKFETAPLKKRSYSLTQTGNQVLRESVESLTKITLAMQFMMTRVDMSAQISSPAANKSALALAENFFAERDYAVTKSMTVAGFSGVEYPVDLLAISSTSKMPRVIVRILDKNPITIDDILKTHVMSFDLEASLSVVLSSSPVSEEIAKLADFYHISIFNGRDIEDTVNIMCSSLKL